MAQPGDILVVDDETDIVNLVVELLEDEGYQVRSAFNGEMALAAIEHQQPAMILMDMYMPQMTGMMLLEHLRANGILDIPVVLMTASPRAAETVSDMALVDYLAKPFDIEQLLQCVARNLHRNRSADPASACSPAQS
ncbi:MAG TPA: response regulator [Roseiflexaceae bacterium]|nr:response regulator [Roseiflexaceae bacterium]